jgi:hypothetical protein
MEAGAQSAWIGRELQRLGHEAIMANAHWRMAAPDFDPELNLHRAMHRTAQHRMRMEARVEAANKIFVDTDRRLMEGHAFSRADNGHQNHGALSPVSEHHGWKARNLIGVHLCLSVAGTVLSAALGSLEAFGDSTQHGPAPRSHPATKAFALSTR